MTIEHHCWHLSLILSTAIAIILHINLHSPHISNANVSIFHLHIPNKSVNFPRVSLQILTGTAVRCKTVASTLHFVQKTRLVTFSSKSTSVSIILLDQSPVSLMSFKYTSGLQHLTKHFIRLRYCNGTTNML